MSSVSRCVITGSRLAARRAKGIPDSPPSKITDNSEQPWLTGPAKIYELVA